MLKKHNLLLIVGVLFQVIAYCQADFSIQGKLCVNETLTFSNESLVNADSVHWDFGNGTASQQNVVNYTYATAGVYTITFTIYNSGQDYSDNRTINIHELPNAAFRDSTLIFASFARVFIDESVYSGSVSKYTWDFGDGSTVLETDSAVVEYKFKQPGDYTVWHWMYDNNQCVDSVSATITIEDIFNVPNVFTPNSDGINDEFIITTNGVDHFSIDIFGRWGNLVFRREGQQQIVWDGRMPDGSMVLPGTYYYVITVLDSDKAYEPTTGFISVFTSSN